MRHIGILGIVALGLALGLASSGRAADALPYPTPGTENAVTYSFTAANTGHVTAYFAGSTAAYENDLGMEINGVLSPAGFGLNNHTSAIGDMFDLGAVNAGDALTFVMRNIWWGGPGSLGNLYSDHTRNADYDDYYAPSTSRNHVYSTPYSGTGPIVFPGVPAGKYVAFEDLPGSDPYNDWNYYDESFVFTNVRVHPVVPLPAAVWGGMILLGSMIGLRVGFRRRA